MKNITVEDILNIADGELIIGDKNLICENFSKDTREINVNDVYVGIKGEKFDGSKFWKDALDKGASCVIVENIIVTEEERNKYSNKTIIKVDDTLEALYKIARFKRDLYVA